jgi:hypothetical protein
VPELNNPIPVDQEVTTPPSAPNEKEWRVPMMPTTQVSDPIMPVVDKLLNNLVVRGGQWSAWGWLDPIPGYSRVESAVLGGTGSALARRTSWLQETGIGTREAYLSEGRKYAPADVAQTYPISWAPKEHRPDHLPMMIPDFFLPTKRGHNERTEFAAQLLDFNSLLPDWLNPLGIVHGILATGAGYFASRARRAFLDPQNIPAVVRQSEGRSVMSNLYRAHIDDMNGQTRPLFDWNLASGTNEWMAESLTRSATAAIYNRYHADKTVRDALMDNAPRESSHLIGQSLSEMVDDPRRFGYAKYWENLHNVGTDDALRAEHRRIRYEYFGALAHDELAIPFTNPAIYGPSKSVVSDPTSARVSRAGRDQVVHALTTKRINQIHEWDKITNAGEDKVLVAYLALPLNSKKRKTFNERQLAAGSSEWVETFGESYIPIPTRRERNDMISEMSMLELVFGNHIKPKSHLIDMIKRGDTDNLPRIPKDARYAGYQGADEAFYVNQPPSDLMKQFYDIASSEGWLGIPASERAFIENHPEYRDLFFNPEDNDGSMRLAYLMRADKSYIAAIEEANRKARRLPSGHYSTDRLPYAKFPYGLDMGPVVRVTSNDIFAETINVGDYVTFPEGNLTSPDMLTGLANFTATLDEFANHGATPTFGLQKAAAAHQVISENIRHRFPGKESVMAYDIQSNMYYDRASVLDRATQEFTDDLRVKLNIAPNEDIPIRDYEKHFNRLVDNYITRSSAVSGDVRAESLTPLQGKWYNEAVRRTGTGPDSRRTMIEGEHRFTAFIRKDPALVGMVPFSTYIDRVLTGAYNREYPGLKIATPSEEVLLNMGRASETATKGFKISIPTLLANGAVINYHGPLTATNAYITSNAPYWSGFQIAGMTKYGAETMMQILQENRALLLRNESSALTVDGTLTKVGQLVEDSRTAPIYITDYNSFFMTKDTALPQKGTTEYAGKYVPGESYGSTMASKLVASVAPWKRLDELTLQNLHEVAQKKHWTKVEFSDAMVAIREDAVHERPPLVFDELGSINDPTLAHPANQKIISDLTATDLLQRDNVVKLELPKGEEEWSASLIYDGYMRHLRPIMLTRSVDVFERLHKMEGLNRLVPTPDNINKLRTTVEETAMFLPYYTSVVGQDPMAEHTLTQLNDGLIDLTKLIGHPSSTPELIQTRFDEATRALQLLSTHMQSNYGAYWKIQAAGMGLSHSRLFVMLEAKDNEILGSLNSFLTQADEYYYSLHQALGNDPKRVLTPNESAFVMKDLLTKTTTGVSKRMTQQDVESVMPNDWYYELNALGDSFVGENSIITRLRYTRAQQQIYRLGSMMDEMAASRKVPTPDQLKLFDSTYDEVRSIVPIVRERIVISRLEQLAAKVGTNAAKGASIYAKALTEISALSAFPILTGIAEQYFNENSTDDEITIGEQKIRAAYSVRSIDKNTMELGLRYARTYKAANITDSYGDMVKEHAATAALHAQEVPIIRAMRATEYKDYEQTKLYQKMRDNPYFTQLYVASVLHDYGAQGTVGYLRQLERNTGMSSMEAWHELRLRPEIDFGGKVELLGGMIQRWLEKLSD